VNGIEVYSLAERQEMDNDILDLPFDTSPVMAAYIVNIWMLCVWNVCKSVSGVPIVQDRGSVTTLRIVHVLGWVRFCRTSMTQVR